MNHDYSIIEDIGIKDIVFSIIMILSVVVITNRWLSRFGESDPVIVAASIILVGALAALILSIEFHLRRIVKLVESGDHTLASSIQDVEDSMDKKLNSTMQNTNNKITELSKRLYR
ncbi:MAG: hypothetical protein LAKADJCE_00740 [Candidatus Argoarchaeum ethanivorans]|uniref:Uncharacterized protein n=1 Tax=Candidatus Argoarchaeum ethanivorans TaxID=2608793 RepID=A0A811TIT9_9EURY|nr:MAG: hypothetical protein LAKADJCE_00740 [Candidatus Argoarchaeum ethanivorans]